MTKLKSYDVNSKKVAEHAYKMRRSTSKTASYSAAYGGGNTLRYAEFLAYIQTINSER